VSRSAEPIAEFLERIRVRLGTIQPDFADRLRYRVRLRCEAEGVAAPEWAARRQKHSARPPAAPLAPAAPLEVPAALSAWRRGGEGRVVEVGRRGIVLHELGAEPRRFASVAAAVAAIGLVGPVKVDVHRSPVGA
jgi:hypothetical protein